MATIVMVHGAFNELWGPNELHHRWLPALRDGLWHVGAEVDADDVDVCFYGDLFRRDPESPDQVDEATRAGVADMLSETLGDDGLTALEQAAGRATNPGWPRSSGPGSSTAWSTTATAPTTRSPT